jgi:hypothetical protein
MLPLQLIGVNQPQIHFLNQVGCLQRVPPALILQKTSRQPPQLAVNSRDQFRKGPLVTAGPSAQQLRGFRKPWFSHEMSFEKLYPQAQNILGRRFQIFASDCAY